jgi:hypothetical protein
VGENEPGLALPPLNVTPPHVRVFERLRVRFRYDHAFASVAYALDDNFPYLVAHDCVDGVMGKVRVVRSSIEWIVWLAFWLMCAPFGRTTVLLSLN